MGALLKFMVRMAALVGGSIFATSAVNNIADAKEAEAMAAAAAAKEEEKPFFLFLGKIMPLLKMAVLGLIGLMFFRNVDLSKLKR